jgi:hypothetical protein
LSIVNLHKINKYFIIDKIVSISVATGGGPSCARVEDTAVSLCGGQLAQANSLITRCGTLGNYYKWLQLVTKWLNHVFYAKCRAPQPLAPGRLSGIYQDSWQCRHRKRDNRPCVFSQKFFLFYFQIKRMGGGFRDKKNFFLKNRIYVTKIPTKSILDFRLR